MDAAVHQRPASGGLPLRALLTALMARRRWVMGSVLVFTSLSIAAAFMLTPVYRATTVLAPANLDRGADLSAFTSSPLGGLASGLGLGPKDAETEEAIAVLRSREFTENFISRQHLMRELFATDWNPATGTWKTGLWRPPTIARAFKYFDTSIRSITQDRKTGLVTIQIDWINRNDAAVWANELVQQLNEEMRSRAIAKAEVSTQFLNKELQATATVEGRDAISRLLEAELKRRMLATVTHDYSFRVVDRAMPPDPDDRVRPQRALMIVAGVLVGLGVSVVPALLLGSAHAYAGEGPPST